MEKAIPLDKAGLETWAVLDDLLRQSHHLHSIELFCGTGDLKANSDLVAEQLQAHLLHSVRREIHMSNGLEADGRKLAVDLFGDEWTAHWEESLGERIELYQSIRTSLNLI